MSEDNKPRCYDSTRIEKHDPMFSIESSDYSKEIRIVETTSMYPRICLIDNKEHSKRNFAFIEVKDDKAFEQVWKALMQITSCAHSGEACKEAK